MTIAGDTSFVAGDSVEISLCSVTSLSMMEAEGWHNSVTIMADMTSQIFNGDYKTLYLTSCVTSQRVYGCSCSFSEHALLSVFHKFYQLIISRRLMLRFFLFLVGGVMSRNDDNG